MARQISGGLIQPAANAIAAHNATHRSVVALEAAKPHYDGSEWDPTGAEQVISATLGVPANLADAITVVLASKVIFNDHLTRHNGGSGLKIFAHKALDAGDHVATPDTAPGATETQTILTALITLVTEERIRYEAHRANGGGVWHTTADTINVLGGLPVLTTFEGVADALNLLKAEYEAHRVLVGGGPVHAMADAVNVVTSPNAVASDIDSCITLANELRTLMNAHRGQAGVHAIDDNINAVAGAAVSYPADLFTLANGVKAASISHFALGAAHEVADAAVVTAADATTIATLITLAADIRTKLDAHFRNAPVTQAERGVA